MPSRVRLLGASEIRSTGDWQPLPRDKRGALLIHLALGGDWVAREQLAFLFWPDRRDSEARRNLRQLLRRLRDLEIAGDLEVAREQLRWPVDSDVADFRSAAARRDWDETLTLYRGDLCSDFLVNDAPVFGSWLEEQRQSLRGVWHDSVLACSHGLRRGGRHGEAARLLERLWGGDELDEQVLHAYLRALHAHGERERALEVFERFRQRLEGELGVEPLADTLALIASIRTGSAPAESGISAESGALPDPGTPFFERAAELAETATLLAEPDCRLLVVVGAGGTGKTRLALELARRRHERGDGVHFVPLDGGVSPELLVEAIAAAIGFEFFGPDDPSEQLGDYLRGKELLLVLDGFETLLEQTGLLTELLADAPGLRLLLTSRAAPEVAQAWIYRLGGLDWRSGDSPDTGDAFRFFVQAARRSDPRYRLRSEEIEDIAEICRLTEGLPLALEMAAAWVRQLSPGEIGEEIALNLDFLRDRGEQGGGMRAVFEHSWNLLSPEQQEVFARLAVFRGGFDRRAARAVTGSGLYTLLLLVGKSLLRKSPSGRYGMHELTRAFAIEQLARSDELESTRQAHGSYFCNRLHEHEGDFESGGLQQAVEAIARDLDNIRAAWQWAIERQQRSLLLAAARPLGAFLTYRGLFAEGERLFAAAAEVPTGDEAIGLRLRAETLGQRGGFAHRLGDSERATADLRRSLELFERRGGDRDVGLALHRLAETTLAAGEYQATRELSERGLALARDLGDGALECRHLLLLGGVDIYSGGYREALDRHRAALELSRDRGDRIAEISALDGLATVLSYLGRHEEAREIAVEAHRIQEIAGSPQALARSRYRLGAAAFQSGDYPTAEEHFRAARDAFDDIGDRRAVAGALQALGAIEFSRRDYRAGAALAREAIDLFSDLGHSQGIAEMTHKLALFTKLDGDLDEGERLYLRSLELAREIGAERDEILCLDGLAHIATDRERYDDAWRYTCTALRRSLATGSQGLLFHCLVNPFRLLAAQGDTELARTLATVTLEHPAANASIRAKATATLEGLRDQEQAPANPAAAEPVAAPERTIEQIVAELLAEKAVATDSADASGVTGVADDEGSPAT